MLGEMYEHIMYLEPVSCTTETVFNPMLIWEPLVVKQELFSMIYSMAFPHTKEEYDQAVEKRAAIFDQFKADGYTALKCRVTESAGLGFRLFVTKSKILMEAK